MGVFRARTQAVRLSARAHFRPRVVACVLCRLESALMVDGSHLRLTNGLRSCCVLCCCRSASNRNELFFGPMGGLPESPSPSAESPMPSSQPPAADGTQGVSNSEQVQQLLVRAFRKHNVYGKRSTEVGRFVGAAHEGAVTAKSALRPSWGLLESSRMTRMPTTRSIPLVQGPSPCTAAYDMQQCDQVRARVSLNPILTQAFSPSDGMRTPIQCMYLLLPFRLRSIGNNPL